MARKHTLLKILLPLVVLIVGAVVMVGFIKNRQPPRQVAKPVSGILVETLQTRQSHETITVRATGTVRPRREARLAPQISGRVVTVSPKLIEGGFFNQGELMFAIEAVDYRLAVDRARADLAGAQLNLATVESQARIARKEWETLKQDGEAPNPLVLYKPQLAEARARVASATAAVAQARLNLARTRVNAPFNCRVVAEDIDPGQFVQAGGSPVTVIGTDVAEILVPVPLAELQWLEIPGPNQKQLGSTAVIRLPNQAASWEGRVSRSLAEVDNRGRMPRLAVRIEDPFNLQLNAAERPPLAMGLFVEVELQGPRRNNLVSIPRKALRAGDTVWLVDNDSRLQIQKVDVLRYQQDHALITAGLDGGEKLVLTPISGAAPGMRLRTADNDGAARGERS